MKEEKLKVAYSEEVFIGHLKNYVKLCRSSIILLIFIIVKMMRFTKRTSRN
jgi:hypothetical protein